MMVRQFLVQHHAGDVFLMQFDPNHTQFALTHDRDQARKFDDCADAERVCARLVAGAGVAYEVVTAEG